MEGSIIMKKEKGIKGKMEDDGWAMNLKKKKNGDGRMRCPNF